MHSICDVLFKNVKSKGFNNIFGLYDEHFLGDCFQTWDLAYIKEIHFLEDSSSKYFVQQGQEDLWQYYIFHLISEIPVIKLEDMVRKKDMELPQ